MNRKLTASLAALAAALGLAGAAAGTRPAGAAQPLVTIVRHGGLCLTDATTAGECRSVLRITETTISRDGLVSRPLTRAERRELTRAIRGLNAAYFRKHPFTGTCPIAYDGTESIYRFRGFPLRLASCRFDVQGVPAVELTERLLATLKRRG